MPSGHAAEPGADSPGTDRDAYAERAETYLRLLAESVLRPRAHPDAPGQTAEGQSAGAELVVQAATLLVEAGVLTDIRVSWILLDLSVALRARGEGESIWTSPYRLRRLTGFAPRRDPGTLGRWRVVPGPAPVPGAHVMALVLTSDRVLAPATLWFPPTAGLPDLQGPPLGGLIATDDSGTSYQITFSGGSWAGSTWTGTLMLHPALPVGSQWLQFLGPNGPLVLIPLPSSAAPGEAPPRPVSQSPGERLLTRHAEAVLASLSDMAAGRYEPVRPEFPQLVGTLESAGALSALSPLPRQVAALHTMLGLSDEGAGEPGRPGDLPVRWLDVATHYGRRRHLPPASGSAAIGASLPEFDGARFAIAGLRSGPAGSFLHLVARGLRPLRHRLPPGLERDAGFSWWLRDDAGGWHLGTTEEANAVGGEVVLRMALLPPLAHRTATLTAEITGVTKRVTAAVPLRW